MDSFHIKAMCAEGTTEVPRILAKRPALRAIWKVFGVILACMAWFGACSATLIALTWGYELVTARVPGTAQPGARTAGSAVFTLCCLGALFLFGQRLVRWRCIDLDLVAISLGSAAAVVYLAVT